ncbi:serine/threonine protein kinase, partial [Streptomyces sp. B1866]|nr:serine/threonine protein kinase [Streptomyces sp. B1866]
AFAAGGGPGGAAPGERGPVEALPGAGRPGGAPAEPWDGRPARDGAASDALPRDDARDGLGESWDGREPSTRPARDGYPAHSDSYARPDAPVRPGVPARDGGTGAEPSSDASSHAPAAPQSAGWDAGWDQEAGPTAARRGPATALAAERARQARVLVIGAVTERWAPEQASPVHSNWHLAPPVGPAADLWAVGVLLFRAVQGHAPYPEESAAELVQLVCSEDPAYAEECGPLRPVVESLLRKDPADRPGFEELRGWLRSLIRSAPEPDLGSRTINVPSDGAQGGPADPRKLPIVRRRGWLERWRRAQEPGAGRGRHKRGRAQRRPAAPPV